MGTARSSVAGPGATVTTYGEPTIGEPSPKIFSQYLPAQVSPVTCTRMLPSGRSTFGGCGINSNPTFAFGTPRSDRSSRRTSVMLKVTSEESKLVVTLVQILLVGRCAWLGGRMGANSNQWLSEGFPATIASSTAGPRAIMDFAGQVQCSRAAMALDL